MKNIIHILIGTFVVFWLMSCAKWNDTQTASGTTEKSQEITSAALTDMTQSWGMLSGSVMPAQEKAEVEDLSKKLQEVNASIATAIKSQTAGSWATTKSLIDQKQELLKEFQNKIVAVRKEQELVFKQQMDVQNTILAERTETQKKIAAEHQEKIAQVDASIQALLKEREVLIKQQTGFVKPDSPESKKIADIGQEIKKLQDQKQVLAREFQSKNSQLLADWKTKMDELQKMRQEKTKAYSERIKIIQLSQNPPTK